MKIINTKNRINDFVEFMKKDWDGYGIDIDDYYRYYIRFSGKGNIWTNRNVAMAKVDGKGDIEIIVKSKMFNKFNFKKFKNNLKSYEKMRKINITMDVE